MLAGDICYERDLAARVVAWLEALARRGARVLVGDPGRSYLPRERLEALATYEVPVTRTLEDADIKRTSVWGFRRHVTRGLEVERAAHPDGVVMRLQPVRVALRPASRRRRKKSHSALRRDEAR